MTKKPSFQQSMDRLEEIVSLLEKNEIELEDAIALFEEGLQLVHTCNQQLKGFEDTVHTLMHNYEEGENNA